MCFSDISEKKWVREENPTHRSEVSQPAYQERSWIDNMDGDTHFQKTVKVELSIVVRIGSVGHLVVGTIYQIDFIVANGQGTNRISPGSRPQIPFANQACLVG